jgi:hypothetical protein
MLQKFENDLLTLYLLAAMIKVPFSGLLAIATNFSVAAEGPRLIFR